jgi:hypothetical protein
VSVPEMKAFLGLIIKIGLMPLPDIDYWSSEWITHNIFCDVMSSRVCFLQIFWMMHVGNDTTEERNRAIKRTRKVHGVIEYIEKQFQKYLRVLDLPSPQQRFLGLFIFNPTTVLHVLVPKDHHQVDTRIQ